MSSTGPLHVGSHSLARVRALLPYVLDWDITVTRYEPPRLVETAVRLSLNGRFGMHGYVRYRFNPQPGNVIEVLNEQEIAADQPVPRFLHGFFQWAFGFNHDWQCAGRGATPGDRALPADGAGSVRNSDGRQMTTPVVVVERFNAAINARDPEALDTLMTDDHEFVDAEGGSVQGKEACLAAWRGFFAQFPDYRNTFMHLESVGDVVGVAGHSSCSVAVLDGPALWSARVVDGKVAQWRVYTDTPDNREALRIQTG